MQFFGFHKDESKENLLYLEKFNKTLKEKETSLIKQLQPIVKIERIDESPHAEPVRSPSPEKNEIRKAIDPLLIQQPIIQLNRVDAKLRLVRSVKNTPCSCESLGCSSVKIKRGYSCIFCYTKKSSTH